MKLFPIRDILFILLTILLILAVVITAYFSPFDKSTPKASQVPVHRTGQAQVPTVVPTPVLSPTLPAVATTLTVAGKQWGLSTCYIGAVEGSSNFNIADLQDLGINVYHIYGSMDRWEAKDDNSAYGLPTIAQIKANPDVIDWSTWDAAMTDPPGGSDYWWIGAAPAWQGNARTLFSELQANGIRIILDLRNRDDHNRPSWAPDPPATAADWNEWWEHVFALVYWLNVRNHYNVNDFEVQNEPDLSSQGWHGTLAQYEQLVQYTNDAIHYVYSTYLPGHTYHLYGPNSTGNSQWPDFLMKQGIIDSVSIHNYLADTNVYIKRVHAWMDANGYANAPLWLSEWGSYTKNKYVSASFGITMLNNLIRQSTPGNSYIYGSTVFALYDYAVNAVGLISFNGERRVDYYALRLGIRALQGCRPTYQTTIHAKNAVAITTRNKDGSYSLLVTNSSIQQPYTIDANLSAFVRNGSGTIQRFDVQHLDTTDGYVTIVNGHTFLTVPPGGALLLTFS